MINAICLYVGGLFLGIGLVVLILEVLGVYRMKFVLNRMHVAAMGDTLGLGSCVLGLMIMSGFRFATLKLILLIVFFWLSSPVSSHMLARLEVTINEKLTNHLTKYTLEQLEGKTENLEKSVPDQDRETREEEKK